MPPPSAYTWDAKLARYRDQSGRLVATAVVRQELDQTLVSIEAQVRWLAEEYRAGHLSLESWYGQMRDVVKLTHSISAAAARGGWGQMDQAAWGQVGSYVRSEYGYLQGFTNELSQGLTVDGFFLQRSLLYAQAGRETYTAAERNVQADRGMTHEANVLHVAEHCDGPDSCLEQTLAGWVPIGDLVIVGQRACGRRCKCSLRYRGMEP